MILIIAVSAASTALRTVFISLNGDVYRAKGHFKTPLVLQIVDIIITIPLCFFSLKDGFWTFVYVRAITKLVLILPEQILLRIKCNISMRRTAKNLLPCLVATGVMGVCAVLLHGAIDSIVYDVISIAICVIVYFGVLIISKSEREYIFGIIKKLKK